MGDGDTEFEDIDLGNEPDWAGYDERAEDSVGIYELKSQILRAKNWRKLDNHILR